MNSAESLDTHLTERSIERELDLVVGAIRMVAAGGAPGVTLVGLDFGPAVLERLAQEARDAGITLEPLWHPDESGCDIRVHRPNESSDAD